MALSRNLQVLELSGLRLDQPLTQCGRLSPSEIQLASEARFSAVQQAFQTAIDRRVDLVVMHSGMLTEESAGGRAPWYLARLIENCAARDIPVVWAERLHNSWMERFVTAPTNMIRMTAGDVRRVTTKSGVVLVQAGRPTTQTQKAWQDEVHATLGIDLGASSRLDLETCDLVLHDRVEPSDLVDDFVAATRESQTTPLASLHTLRTDRANGRESLTLASLGLTRVSCSLSEGLSTNSLAEHLGEEVDAAAGRYLASQPQTQLVFIDLKVTGHGAAWDSLWSSDLRESLIAEMNRLTRHPVCHVRSIEAIADGVEAARACSFTPTLNAIWSESTARPTHAVRSLADLSPDSVALSDWSRHQPIPVDHPLAPEVRQACLHLLRSAS